MGLQLSAYIPFVIIAATLFIALGVVAVCRYRARRKGLRSPFSQKSERIPGQRLLKRLDELNEEISIQAGALFSVPIAIYAASLSRLYFGNRAFDPIEGLTAVAVAVGFLGYTLFKLRRFRQERRKLRLEYEGRMIVGQALDRLILPGGRVFHDFPAEDFAIDHILVGAKGVFAIGTRTCANRRPRNLRQDATVTYDGRALHFSNGTDIEMVAQARRQAEWLSGWLSRAADEQIAVRAIIALPGWLVRRTAAEGMPIVNPRQFDSLFEHIPPRPMSAGTITRIIHHLDLKYRETAPPE